MIRPFIDADVKEEKVLVCCSEPEPFMFRPYLMVLQEFPNPIRS